MECIEFPQSDKGTVSENIVGFLGFRNAFTDQEEQTLGEILRVVDLNGSDSCRIDSSECGNYIELSTSASSVARFSNDIKLPLDGS